MANKNIIQVSFKNNKDDYELYEWLLNASNSNYSAFVKSILKKVKSGELIEVNDPVNICRPIAPVATPVDIQDCSDNIEPPKEQAEQPVKLLDITDF